MKRILISFVIAGLLVSAKLNGWLGGMSEGAFITLVVTGLGCVMMTLAFNPVDKFIRYPVPQGGDYAKILIVREARRRQCRSLRVTKKRTGHEVEGQIVQLSVQNGTFTLKPINGGRDQIFHVSDVDQIDPDLPDPQNPLLEDDDSIPVQTYA